MPYHEPTHKKIIDSLKAEGVHPHSDYHDDRDSLRELETIVSRVSHPAYKVSARELADHITDPYELFIAFYKKINGVTTAPRKIQMLIDKVDNVFRLKVLLRHPDSPKMVTSKHHPLYGLTATYFESLGFRDIVKVLDCGRAPVGFIMYSFGYSMIPNLSDLLEIMPDNYRECISGSISEGNAKVIASELMSILMISEDGRKDPLAFYDTLAAYFNMEDVSVRQEIELQVKTWEGIALIMGLTNKDSES